MMWQVWFVVVVEIPRKNLHLQLVSSTEVPLPFADLRPIHPGPEVSWLKGSWTLNYSLVPGKHFFGAWGRVGFWFKPH